MSASILGTRRLGTRRMNRGSILLLNRCPSRRSRTRGCFTRTGPTPVSRSRSGRCPLRTTSRRPDPSTSYSCRSIYSATSFSIACCSICRSPSYNNPSSADLDSSTTRSFTEITLSFAIERILRASLPRPLRVSVQQTHKDTLSFPPYTTFDYPKSGSCAWMQSATALAGWACTKTKAHPVGELRLLGKPRASALRSTAGFRIISHLGVFRSLSKKTALPAWLDCKAPGPAAAAPMAEEAWAAPAVLPGVLEYEQSNPGRSCINKATATGHPTLPG